MQDLLKKVSAFIDAVRVLIDKLSDMLHQFAAPDGVARSFLSGFFSGPLVDSIKQALIAWFLKNLPTMFQTPTLA